MRRLVAGIICMYGAIHVSVAQPPGLDRNALDAEGRKQGLWVKTWPSTGEIRYQGQFKDDRPLGKFRYYNEDGVLTSTMEFYDGGKKANSVHFHLDGTLMAKGSYIGQIKDSTWNYYDEQGQLRKTESYVDGKPHGLVTSYFRDGSVAERIRFDHGVQVAEWKQYHPNGMVRAEGYFEAGQPQGEMVWYYDTGRSEIRGKYLNGLKNGAWIYYNEDGSVQLQMLFESGEFVKSSKENGVFKDYYDDDQLKNEVTWKNGKRNGPFKEYFDNGVWVDKKSTADPVLGIEGGEDERVLEGQSLRLSGNYKDDKLHGVLKEYNVKGKVIREERYVEGVKQ